MRRTSMQKTNTDGFPKAAEVIEITGAHELEAMDRAALTPSTSAPMTADGSLNQRQSLRSNYAPQTLKT